MVLGVPVYDVYGKLVYDKNTQIDSVSLQVMTNKGINELLVKDKRALDVVVIPMFSPEVEGQITDAFRTLVLNNLGKDTLSPIDLTTLNIAINDAAESMTFQALGGVNIAGGILPDDYIFFQSVRTATLALVVGHKLGLKSRELARLGMAAVLKDIACIIDPNIVTPETDRTSEEQRKMVRTHPEKGYEILCKNPLTKGEIATAVLQHHECWDGSGYPKALKANTISTYAQIIAIADGFASLLYYPVPGKKRTMPHEAIEFVMAYAGDKFKQELVDIFAKQVPCYSAGTSILLNTGEKALVINPNLGVVARPVVRICTDIGGQPLPKTFDVNLAKSSEQHRLISKVLEFD